MKQVRTSIAWEKTTALALFEYVIAKLVGIDQPPAMIIEESNNKLGQRSLSWYMKILYLLGLASCTIILEEDENRRELHLPPQNVVSIRGAYSIFLMTLLPSLMDQLYMKYIAL